MIAVAALIAPVLKVAKYLFTNPKILGIVVLVAVFGFMKWQLDSYKEDNQKLMNENSAIRVELALSEQQLKIQEEVQRILSTRAKEKEQEAKDLAAQLEEIASAPATDDGPVAPVLRKAIEGLK